MRSRFWGPLVGPPVWAAALLPAADPEPASVVERVEEVSPPVESVAPLRGAYARRAAK